MKLQRPIGTYDITPDEAVVWSHLEERIRSMFIRYNYGEIRTPIFEYTELFQRGVGEASDIVAKEMYTFQDRGGRSLTLRPEGTAGVVRAFIENGLEKKNPGVVKLFYIAPMFRYERKQRGRFRQHVQYGCEIFGSEGPEIDIELLVMLNRFYQDLGLTELDLKINSVGCPVCRPVHRDEFVSWARPYLKDFCEDCLRRFESNPLRMFDCKVKRCQEILQHAPRLLDKLCENCRSHFDSLQEGLHHHSVSFEVDSKLVRGLDYYTRTAFEMSYAPLGSQGVLMGGGRYDGLVDYLGGAAAPGIGFGAGMERLIMILDETGRSIAPDDGVDLFAVILGDRAVRAAGDLLAQARSLGLRCDRDFTGKSMKKQFQMADKLGAKFAAVIGDNEIDKKVIVLKNLKEGHQEEIPWSEDLHELLEKINAG
ncbi:MAG: histidine--tRNA ligase [Candidatus Omnitrophica bacterium]|nr:histidine--tRNA ligase [Candidatus Omnitrophota bacterium]